MEEKKLRICIDLDGTICTIKKPDETYADVKVQPGAKEFIDSLKADGHTIIINTARNMQTQGHNVGKVLKNVGKITLDWLEENKIQYDEIFFGKPNADITIDDRVMKFEDWRKMDKNQVLKMGKDIQGMENIDMLQKFDVVINYYTNSDRKKTDAYTKLKKEYSEKIKAYTILPEEEKELVKSTEEVIQGEYNEILNNTKVVKD